MELCTRGLGGSVSQLRSRGIQLGCVRTLVVVAEERPRISLCSSFAALFAPLGLSPRAVSTSFGCRQNIAICLQVGVAYHVHYCAYAQKRIQSRKQCFGSVYI
jgi:hypothetical protein